MIVLIKTLLFTIIFFVILGCEANELSHFKKIEDKENLLNLNEDSSQIPFENAIKITKGLGSRKILVFYEIDCSYCKSLEKYELSQVNDLTVYNFLYVNDDKESASWKKAKSIWCSSDVKKTWNDFILNDYLAKNTKSCVTPFEQNKVLAKKLGVKGTPTIFFSNGTKATGIIKAKQIEQRILDSDFYSN